MTVGICAFNEERRIGSCLSSVTSQQIPEGSDLTEVLVVASGCTDGTERIVEAWQTWDARVALVRQPQRMGKASALNEILNQARGELIILLNADAVLQEHALAALIGPFMAEPDVVLACGAPTADDSQERVARVVADFHWRLHNRTLDAMSRQGLPNHCCDEFMAMRRGFVTALPRDLVNDGAYLGALASLRGSSVRFCPAARVWVEIPRSVSGFLMQRRRILRGHDQVDSLLQHPSNTLENLFRREPITALAILGRQILSRPRALFAFLFVVLPLEMLAYLFAMRDRQEGIRYDPAWHPVG